MRRGLGLGKKFAEEKFKNCWREYATKEEIEYLDQVYGGAWCQMSPQKDWEEFIGFKPDSENYLEFLVLIYPNGEPYSLVRFLVPRDETKNNGFLIWNHYKGSAVFQEI